MQNHLFFNCPDAPALATLRLPGVVSTLRTMQGGRFRVSRPIMVLTHEELPDGNPDRDGRVSAKRLLRVQVRYGPYRNRWPGIGRGETCRHQPYSPL